jgi:UDPglucose 6-dehydrogenase
VAALQAAGATIRAYDPESMTEAKSMMEDVIWCENAYEVMEEVDALSIVTEWNEFRALDLERMKSLLKDPILVDLRNIYDADEMEKAGFNYSCIGRPRV